MGIIYINNCIEISITNSTDTLEIWQNSWKVCLEALPPPPGLGCLEALLAWNGFNMRPETSPGFSQLMWRRLELSYTFLSRGEGNAKIWVAENQRRGNHRKSPKIPGIPQSFQAYFIKKNAWYLLAGKCQEYFRMACAVCEFGCCKTAIMRVICYIKLYRKIFSCIRPSPWARVTSTSHRWQH